MENLLVQKEIENAEKVLLQKKRIIWVLERFDGKVLNVRLKKELEEKTGLRISTESRFGKTELVAYFKQDDRYIMDKNGRVHYLQKDYEYLANLFDVETVDENRRIIADNWVDAVEKQMKKIEQRVEKTKKELSKVKQQQKRKAELLEMIEAFNKDIDPTVDSYYQLKISVRR